MNLIANINNRKALQKENVEKISLYLIVENFTVL